MSKLKSITLPLQWLLVPAIMVAGCLTALCCPQLRPAQQQQDPANIAAKGLSELDLNGGRKGL